MFHGENKTACREGRKSSHSSWHYLGMDMHTQGSLNALDVSSCKDEVAKEKVREQKKKHRASVHTHTH